MSLPTASHRDAPRIQTLALAISFVAMAVVVQRGLSASGSSPVQEVELEILPVQGNVIMLQTPTAGGNMAVLPGPDGSLLVDDQVPALTESVIAGVAAVSDDPLRFVINTHVHIDHIGGNAPLAAGGVTVVAHDNVRTRMLEELRIPRGGGIFMDQPPPEARPVVTYETTLTFHLNGEEVRVFRVPPAHTDGDSFVYFADSDVLHTGDVFRTNMYPIVDVYNGGSYAGMMEALEVALGIAGPDTKFIPGHGFGFTDRDGVEEVLAMMADIRATVREMIARGMDLDAVMAAEPTAAYDEEWGQVDSWTARDLVPIVYFEEGGGPPTVP